MTNVPEYRPYGGYFGFYPEPEPESAGKDSSHVSRALLAVADVTISHERQTNQVLSEALEKAWSLIRYERERAETLGKALEDAYERERTLREHVEMLTCEQTWRAS